MSFIKTPYLPQNKVKTIIAGNGILRFNKALSNLGVSILITEENAVLGDSVGSHADLCVNHLGDNHFLVEKGQGKLKTELTAMGADCRFIDKSLLADYPGNCLLNCAFINNGLICNKSCVSHEIIKYAERNNLYIYNVNQGYTKCSVCAVSENAYITDDISIYNVLKERKFDVLLVEKGSVRLHGYNYGFIGGCCGKISRNEIAFCGDVKRHSNYSDIKSFCDNYSINLISLDGGELLDIGSIIPITEKEVLL